MFIAYVVHINRISDCILTYNYVPWHRIRFYTEEIPRRRVFGEIIKSSIGIYIM